MRQLDAEQHAACCALDISLDAADLTSKVHAGPRDQRQVLVEHFRRIDEGIAVDAAHPLEFRVLQAWNHSKHALLLGPGHARMKPDHVERGTPLILLSQLHHLLLWLLL